MKVQGINLFKPQINEEVGGAASTHRTQVKDTLNHQKARSILGNCFSGLVTVFSWIAGLTLIQWAWTAITFLFKSIGCCFGGSQEESLSWERIQNQTQIILEDAKEHLDGAKKVALFFWVGEGIQTKLHREMIDPDKLMEAGKLLEENKNYFASHLKKSDQVFNIALFFIPENGDSVIELTRTVRVRGVTDRALPCKYKFNQFQNDETILNALKGKIMKKKREGDKPDSVKSLKIKAFGNHSSRRGVTTPLKRPQGPAT